MSNEGDHLIRELKEEMRREQLAKLWQKYGIFLLAGALAIVVGVGGYKVWEARTEAAAQQAGARFEAALTLYGQSKDDEAKQLMEALAQGGHEGYATLARLRLAGQAAEDKRPGDAVRLYQEIAADTQADMLFRDFAHVRIAALKLGEESWTQTKNRLTEVTEAGRPWRSHAQELIGLAAYREGKLSEARQALAELVGDAKVPPAISQRAQVILGMITAKEAPPEVPKAQGEASGPDGGKAKEPAKKD